MDATFLLIPLYEMGHRGFSGWYMDFVSLYTPYMHAYIRTTAGYAIRLEAGGRLDNLDTSAYCHNGLANVDDCPLSDDTSV